MLVVQIKDFVHHKEEDVTNGDADYVVEVDNGRLITRAMVRIHINEANQPPEATTVSGQAMFQSTRYWTSEIEVGFIVTDHESDPADLMVTVSTGATPRFFKRQPKRKVDGANNLSGNLSGENGGEDLPESPSTRSLYGGLCGGLYETLRSFLVQTARTSSRARTRTATTAPSAPISARSAGRSRPMTARSPTTT